MRRRGGFTATQFIVVAAVALLVAAALWTVFMRQPDRDWHVSCQSNLKQLALGLLMYANDNDQRLPPYAYRWAGGVTRWEAASFPYTKDWGVYHCPWQPDSTNWSWSSGTPAPASFFGYGANRAYLFPPQTMALTDVKQPVATIMLADRDALDRDLRAPIADHGAAMDPPCNVALRHDGNTSVDTRPPADRRKGGANFAFADGHLKYMKADDAWSKDDTMWDLK